MAWDQDLDKASVAYKIAAATEQRVRVIAGPGTGKSFAMKRRVARLLESNIEAKKILAVTFMIGEPMRSDCHNAGKANLQRFPGARTTAAWNASIYGVAIKISEDGPITIFEKGNVILQLG